MQNLSLHLDVLLLDGVPVSPGSAPLAFALLLLVYVFIIVSNLGLVLLIWIDRRLHTPMYLLFCNLAVTDVLANVNVVPRVLLDTLRPPAERLISYPECVAQAFWAHLLATGMRTVLMVMAFDRYVAVCLPLRYSAIMSPRMLVKLLVAAWSAALVLVSVLIGLTVRLNRCRLLVVGLQCSNAALFGLSCESVFVNNVYGLTFTTMLYLSSAGSLVLTYGSIIAVSVRRDRTLNLKALRTCLSHLLVYFLSLFSGLTVILFTRFPKLRQERHLASVLYTVLPGCFNPLIYGLQSQEIRNYVRAVFRGSVFRGSIMFRGSVFQRACTKRK
ncbi:olfactory receptor-like protein COR4 [Periophthalmus magnuspinnatus]|uniref:olfactory receptor-like protein COR4 n=1 Tax=Periophthalmus magnuspinnatus TaxID=409849 RepID=UPI00145A46A9|nr:olfactory receptor-like protein COR4 [Periophthalmus magnuspinnatus]